jgi:hypothetical protein
MVTIVLKHFFLEENYQLEGIQAELAVAAL